MRSLPNLQRKFSAALRFPFWRRSAHLLALPNELLLEIARYLTPDIASINALLRTSRSLSVLLDQVLYSAAATALVADGCSPLRASCAAGNTDAVKALLAHGVPVDTQELWTGTTALQAAIMLDRASVVDELVRHGANINGVDRHRWTPLHWSVFSSDSRMAEILLAHGASVEDHARFGGGGTALHFAAGMGDCTKVALLVEFGADVDARDYAGWNPVDYAEAADEMEVVELLVKCGGEATGPQGESGRRGIMQWIVIARSWRNVCVLLEGLLAGRYSGSCRRKTKRRYNVF